MADESAPVTQMMRWTNDFWPSCPNTLKREVRKTLGRQPTEKHPKRGGSPEAERLAKLYRENEKQRAKGGNPL